MTMKVTSKQIRGARVLSGLGVRELAKVAGLSPAAVSQIETGRTKSPHTASLEGLRKALEEYGIEFGPNGWIRHVDDHQGGAGDSPVLAPDKRSRVLRLLWQATRILQGPQDAADSAGGEVSEAGVQDAES